MAVLNPYLNFAGNAREAMTAYQEILGGTLEINSFGDFGEGGHDDGPAAEGVMHANLKTDLGFTLMASDAMAGHEPPTADKMVISLNGEEADTLRGYFERLAEGGTVVMPLEKQVWGDEFGQLVDRFGMPWMVNIVAPQA